VIGNRRRRRIAEVRKRLFRQPDVAAIDGGARRWYLIASASLTAIGILYVVGAGLSIALGPAPTGGEGYLRALAGHPALARINFIAFSLVDVLLVPAALGLYAALRSSSRGLLLVAGACFAVNLVVDLGVTELSSFALVTNAEHYVAASTDAERAMVLATSDASRGVLPAATLLSFVISSVGYLLVAIATYRAVFRKAIGLVGIVGSAEGIAAGFYVLVPALAALILPCLVTVGLWAVFVAIRLARLTRTLPAPHPPLAEATTA
jgi:uncharacterized protein DUF4386